MSDPVTVSVLTHRLEAIVQEMGEAMLRTAYSQILNSSRDFSTALCDAGARLIAQAEHVPIHVGAIPWAVESVRDAFKGRVRPGDLREHVRRMIATNVRHPHDFMGDLRAMIGSARVGERRLLALTADYGAATVLEAVDEILDGAERRARACVATWKDGVYRGETILDDDGHEFTDSWIRATVTRSEER